MPPAALFAPKELLGRGITPWMAFFAPKDALGGGGETGGERQDGIGEWYVAAFA